MSINKLDETFSGSASDITLSHLLAICKVVHPRVGTKGILMAAACLAANRPLALRELRDLVGVAQVSAGQVVKSSSLLEFVEHPQDKRRRNVTLSAKGKALKTELLKDNPMKARARVTEIMEIAARGKGINTKKLPKHVQAYIASLEAKIAA